MTDTQEINEIIMEEIILSLAGVISDEKYNQLVYVFSKMTGKNIEYKN